MNLLHRLSWRKIALFIISLFFFVLAITLMKEGASGLTPLVQNTLSVDNPANGLGFGWLFAYVVMSGSPVAAAALTFLDVGAVDLYGGFTMIAGSRLGASFIVLFIGFLYVLRGRDRASSLGIGLLAFTVTGSIHAAGIPLGIFMLNREFFAKIQAQPTNLVSSFTDRTIDPIVTLVSSILPTWALFPAGIAVIIISFSLFDRCLPQMALKESHVGQVSRLVYRPIIMFLLGATVTLVSMSVSVSLTLLVPLSNRGFIRRENVVPYIMGAGVTTFIDTLLAAALLNNPQAITVVLVEMVSITLISLALLVLVFRPYERAMLGFVNLITESNRNLAIFMIVIFVVPVVLMLF